MAKIDMAVEDQDKLFKLIVKGNTYEEIGEIMNLSSIQISDRIAKYFPYLRDIKFYKENKEDIFNGIQQMALAHIASKMPFAPLKDLTNLVGVIDDKIFRLQNPDKANGTNIQISIENLVQKKEQVIQEFKKNGVNQYEIDKKVAEVFSIDNCNLPIKQIDHALNDTEIASSEVIQLTYF